MSKPLQFSPTRLKVARHFVGLKQIELAELVGVSPSALSQYEHGLHIPGDDVLQRLGFSLGVPRDFFLAESAVPASAPFFRSLRSTPQRERDRAAAFSWLVARVVEAVEEHIRLPACDLRFEGELSPSPKRGEIEEAAARLRVQLGVPPGPVANVVRLLESHGAVAAEFAHGDARLSAFSQWHGTRPIVVFCLGKDDKARQRYDAAHELAHLSLHAEPQPGDHVLEQQADEFASAFLMPASDILPHLPHGRPDWDELQALKRVWGVSIQALIVRAHRLGTLSDRAYQQAFRRLSREGWRRDEPVKLGKPEEPALLSHAFTMLAKKGLTPEGVLRKRALPEALASLGAAALMERPEAPVIPFSALASTTRH